MDEPSGPPAQSDREFRRWLLFWLQFAALAALAIVGARIASADAHPGDYFCGLVLALAAIALALLLVKSACDGKWAGLGDVVLVDDMRQLWLAIPLFAAIGLAGLFVAAAYDEGSLYAAGLALAAVSVLIILFDIKRVYDRLDEGQRR